MSQCSRSVNAARVALVAFIGFAAIGLATPVEAKTCGAGERFAKSLWEKYGELALRYGCAKSKAQASGHALRKTFERCERDPFAAAKIRAGMARFYRHAQVFKSITRHPKRLTFAARDGSLTGTLGRTWINPEPHERDNLRAVIKKRDGKGKASVEVCKFTPDGGAQVAWSFTIDPGKENQGKTWEKALRGVKGTIVSITVDGKSVARSIDYSVRLKRPSQGKIRPPDKSGSRNVISGFADLHAHHMAHLGFAGAWLWGEPHLKLEACTGTNHGRMPLAGYMYRSKHKDRTKPGADWPHHMDTAHQQMHWTHLKQAHEAGLKLIVVPAVSNEFVSELLTAKSTRDPDIPRDDMDSVRLQLRTAHAFAAKYSWYRIARDPWEARRIIADGDLAVVLAVEVSNLMPDKYGDWRHQLEELYDLGVRSIEITHETDNQFGGSAVHHGFTMWAAQKIKHAPIKADHKEKNGENLLGLTQEGRSLVREMARRHMVIEIDHLSRKARRDVFNMVSDTSWAVDVGVANANRQPKPKKLNYYPLFFSHTRFDEIMPTHHELETWIGKNSLGEDEAKAHKGNGKHGSGEYMATDYEALWVRDTGGVFGLRTGPNAMKKYSKSKVAIGCQTSSRSFAQIIDYGVARFGMAMALGSDLDGFVPQIAPRFGNQACSKLGNQEPDSAKRGKPLGGKGGKKLGEFDLDGLKHIGLEGDLLRDLHNLGANVSNLRNRSAENFVRMWERAYDSKRRKLSAAAYAKLMGTAQPSDVRPSDSKYLDKARSSGPTDSLSPKCPRGYPDYETRNPLNKDRCKKTTVTTKPLMCRLLVTDKKKNWTGPHAKKGEDECRSKKGKKPKGTKCPSGYKHNKKSGKDTCTKTRYDYQTPTCGGGRKYKSQKGKDTCVKR